MGVQLAILVAQRLEIAFFQSMDINDCSFAIRYKSRDNGDEWNQRAVYRVCTEHVAAINLASHGIKMLGIATDKFAARTMELCNSCIVMPIGVAYEAVPQVHI